MNSNYCRSNRDSPIEMLEVSDRMVEHLTAVIKNRHDWGRNKQMSIVALGTHAHHTAVLLAKRLRSDNISVRVTNNGQPARLARLTYGRDAIGIHPKYCCLSSATLKFIRTATSEYVRIQGGRVA